MAKSEERIYTFLMPAPQEVEIKFLIPDLRTLEQKLQQLGFKNDTPSTHEVNTIYDLPGQKLRRNSLRACQESTALMCGVDGAIV